MRLPAVFFSLGHYWRVNSHKNITQNALKLARVSFGLHFLFTVFGKLIFIKKR
jgi:hypothetical protein